MGWPVEKSGGEESKFHQSIPAKDLNRLQKAKIAEAAILFRLTVHGFHVFGSPFDGDKTDWLVEDPVTDKILKIQVKWAVPQREGLPAISLQCHHGYYNRRRYQKGEFDFIVAYDYFTDIAYVWSWRDVKHLKNSVTISSDAAECWGKLRKADVA